MTNKALVNWTRTHAIVPLALVLTGSLLCLPPATNGQASAGINQNGPEYIHGQAGLNPVPQHGTGADAQMEQMRLAERQKRVAADTAKLAQLSNELKAQVDQAPKDQISMDMVRKAAEIEKLAHDLNGWLKN